MLPREIHTVEQLTQALDVARRRAARGSGRSRVSLADLAARTGIPRSTVHVYLSGRTLPPPDAFDAVLQALGVPPAELRDWADALERVATPARDDPEPDAGRAADPVPVPHQLPPARRGLVGREPELQALDGLLDAGTDDAAPLVVALTGFGGVGKTTLASAWAARHLDDFPDGQLWIDLHGFGVQTPVAPSAALGRLLRACGVDTSELPADVESRAELFRSAVAGRRLLIVLDNAADSAHVQQLLAGAAECVVVVTSRSDLRSLVAQTGATRLRLTPLDPDSGRDLLLAGGAGDLPTGLTDRLVQHCSGLPLALRILSERIAGHDVNDVEHLTEELDDRRELLDALELTDGHDSYGVRTVLQSSYATLTAELAEVFRVLPLCLGQTVDTENVAACIDASPAVARRRLDALVAANLVQQNGRDRYGVDDLVATFADEVRRAHDDGNEADRRLVRRLTGQAITVSVELDTGWDGKWPMISLDDPTGPAAVAVDDVDSWLADTIELVGAAAERAFARGDVDDGWRLLAWTVRTAIDRADPSPALPALYAALEHVHAGGDLVLEARVLRAIGVAEGSSARFPAATEALERLLDIAHRLDDPLLTRIAEGNLAQVDYLAGRPRRALERFLRLMPDDRPAGRADLGWVNGALTAAMHLGDEPAASGFAATAVAISESEPELGTHRATALLNDAWVRLERGDPPADVLRAVARAREVGGAHLDESLVTMAASLEAGAHLAADRPDAVAAALVPVLALASVQLSPEAMDVQIAHALLLLRTGRREAAAAGARRTAERAARLSMPYQQVQALLVLARVAAGQERLPDGRDAAAAAARLSAEAGYAALERRAHELLADLDAQATA